MNTNLKEENHTRVNNQYLKSKKNDKKDEDLDHDANVWVCVK